jgi:hypothetical protein
MISRITLGLSLCVLSLRRFPLFVTSLPGFPLSSALPLRPSSVTTGGEFDNTASRAFFLSEGVQLRMSCPYTSPQNGKAERMIRTTNNVVRTLLLQASLPARFWAEGLHTATYLLNRLPSTACLAPTPHHALFGTPPRYDHLRVFGCACYPNLSATAPHKLAPRSTRCVFLGYSPDHKGYRCFDLTSRRVLISRHVVFDESDFPYSTSSTPSPDPELETLFPSDPVVQPPVSFFSFPAGSPVIPAAPRAARRPLPRHVRSQCHSPHHARPRSPLLCHARPRRPLPRHARPRRPLLRHAWPRTPPLCHARHRSHQASPRATPSPSRSSDVVRCRYLSRLCRPHHLRQSRPSVLELSLDSTRRSTTRLLSIRVLVLPIPW